MEDKLRALIEGNREANRTKWAIEWQKQGKKVVGVLCSYVPREVMYAAGLLPWRVTGSWSPVSWRVRPYRLDSTYAYSKHVLDSLLSGELDFLDGVIGTDWDKDLLRVWDVWESLGKSRFTLIMHIPHDATELGIREMARSVHKMVRPCQEFGGVNITQESLLESVEVYNRQRSLMLKLYELRKRNVPPLSGAEFLGISTTAMVMPPRQFNQELEALLPYLQQRTPPVSRVSPRLLVSSDHLDNPAYLEVIEDVGALVAMDDLDTGSRYFWQTVNTSSGDLIHALAERYLMRPACPRQNNWNTQAEQVITWVREFNINGVLELPMDYSYPRALRRPFFEKKLSQAGIPFASFSREYYLANEGQLRTRIGALVEMIGVE